MLVNFVISKTRFTLKILAQGTLFDSVINNLIAPVNMMREGKTLHVSNHVN